MVAGSKVAGAGSLVVAVGSKNVVAESEFFVEGSVYIFLCVFKA